MKIQGSIFILVDRIAVREGYCGWQVLLCGGEEGELTFGWFVKAMNDKNGPGRILISRQLEEFQVGIILNMFSSNI